MQSLWHETLSITLAHTFSQLIQRPIPFAKRFTISDRNPMALLWSAKEWSDAAEYLVQKSKDPWVEVFKKQGHLTLKKLGTAVADNFKMLSDHGGSYITINNFFYPRDLRNIAHPPAAISIIGSMSLLNRPTVSIVGSRKASGFSMTWSTKVAEYLSRQGYVVVSGGAIGCDIAAHYGTLLIEKVPAPTIVVLASGLKVFYPRKNQPFFSKIGEEGGAFISERLWHAPCRPFDFPIRNRIICGISRSIILIQGALKSGSYLSANIALDQGRDVFVLQQQKDDVRSYGNLQLIDDGAYSFSSLSDLRDLMNTSST